MIAEEFIFSKHLIVRMAQRGITKSWIIETVEHPDSVTQIADDEVHCYKKDAGFNNKWLKVVVNPENKTIVTAYFDRAMARKETE
jgi:hypothetical protein